MDEQKQKQILEDFAQKWLDTHKDTLMLELINHMLDLKNKLEHQIGTEETEKIFVGDLEEEEEKEDE
jgi:thiaminase